MLKNMHCIGEYEWRLWMVQVYLREIAIIYMKDVEK
jgi:hypothetical protein